MSSKSTIMIEKKTIQILKEFKESPRQTYDEVIRRMAEICREAEMHNQYDKFLHEIQKKKMTEIWDNEYDEVWEDA